MQRLIFLTLLANALINPAPTVRAQELERSPPGEAEAIEEVSARALSELKKRYPDYLRLSQQVCLLHFDGPPLGDILESKKKGRARVIRVEHRAGVQEHDAAANPGKLMLDLERVHGGALRDDFLQKLAKSWNVPLTIAERVEWPAQNVLAVDPERQVVGAADGEHAEVAVKHEQGFAHRVHDGLRERPRILDVLEWLNHAMNAPEPFSF
jgi:hypothetical protein